MDPLISARRPDLGLIDQIKENLLSSGLFYPSGPRYENKRKWKYRQILKKLCNLMLTVITIVIGVLETVQEGLEERLEELEIRGRIITALFILVRILGRVLKTRGE